MKTLQLILITLCVTLFACSTKQSKEVIIKGQLGGVADGTPIHLYERDVDDPFIIDTVYNERFEFVFQDTIVGTLREMNLILYSGQPIVNGTNIWVQPSAQINIKVDVEYPHVWGIESKVSEQIESNKFENQTKKWRLRQSELFEIIDRLLSLPQTDATKIEFDSISALHEPIKDSIFYTEVKLLESKISHSPFWMKKLANTAEYIYYSDNVLSSEGETLGKLYNNLSEEQKKNPVLKDTPMYLFPPAATKVGGKFIEIELLDIEDGRHKISDYTGKYRLLDFWATWCGPCLAATPEMKEVAEEYKDKLVMMTINSEKVDDWKKFSRENEMVGINLHNLENSTLLDHQYNVKGIPHYVLIAPDGTVVDMWSGYSKGSLYKKMEEHIK